MTNQTVNGTYKFVPDYIRKLIKEKGYITQDIIKLWGNNQTGTNRRLSGSVDMSLNEAFQLANLLEVNISTLFAPDNTLVLQKLSN